MPSDLHVALSRLAEQFAAQVLAAVRSASLDELVVDVRPRSVASATNRTATPVAPRGRRPTVVRSNGGGPMGGRAPRGSSSGPEVQAALDKIVALVKTSVGLRSEDIRSRTGLEKTLAAKAFAFGRKKGVLKLKGERRSATYSWNAASQSAPSKPEKK